MAEQPRNGYDPTRLDRIERLVEVLVNEHISLAEDHRLFAEEHKKLLIAQVVLTDRVDKLALAQAESRRDFDERINALIAVVDGLVRKGPTQ
jgi:hypothetical protein